MAPHERRSIRRQELLGLGLLIAFLVVVGGAVALYVAGTSVFHERIRLIVPAVVRSIHMPAPGPAELVLGGAIAVMTVALLALFVHDARGTRSGGKTRSSGPKQPTHT